jgi:hypothetical protein
MGRTFIAGRGRMLRIGMCSSTCRPLGTQAHREYRNGMI